MNDIRRGRYQAFNHTAVLVRHRRFVKGSASDAGCKYPIHLAGVFIYVKVCSCVLTAHQSSRAVRSGAVPVLISLADADQRTVAHIERDKELLSLFRRYRALAEYHIIGIDVVVDGGEAIRLVPSHTVHNDVHHRLTVQHGKALDELHIVYVILEQPTLHICQVLG